MTKIVYLNKLHQALMERYYSHKPEVSEYLTDNVPLNLDTTRPAGARAEMCESSADKRFGE